MGKVELCQHPFCAVVPQRARWGPDRPPSARSARDCWKAPPGAVPDRGEPVGVFSEGTRRHGATIAALFRRRCVRWAVKGGVPLLPVGIGGSEEILASGKKLPRLRRVAVVVGPPIYPSPDAKTRKRSDLAAITAELQVELQQLFDEAMAPRLDSLATPPGAARRKASRSGGELGEHGRRVE